MLKHEHLNTFDLIWFFAELYRGADGKESIEPDEDQNSHECLKATCRGIETSLAECGLKKLRLTTWKLAKVICHTEQRGW